MNNPRLFAEIVQHVENLDEHTVCINFDLYDTKYDETIDMGGYVLSIQDDIDQCFYVTVFNKNHDVLSKTAVPFEFKSEPEEEDL